MEDRGYEINPAERSPDQTIVMHDEGGISCGCTSEAWSVERPEYLVVQEL
ncbi:MAG TPA: hypothetical protein VJ350_00780 [Methanoregula sp.]|nr:hypothetical protein [Methanoregula sp.]